jgi:hypothetical protein
MSAAVELAPRAAPRTGSLALGVRNEARALSPTFVAILAAMAIGSVSENHAVIFIGLLAFAFGSVTLGALSFGLEYSNRTMAMLLSQPVPRHQLYLRKVGVLFAMLAMLAAAAFLLFHDTLRDAASPHTEPSMLLLAAACGLFLAPWLALLSRSSLAAVVFAIAIPGLLATGADLAGAAIHGSSNAAAIDTFKQAVFWRGMVLICALAAVAGWRLFRRLEVIDGHGPELQLPESFGAGATGNAHPAARRHHPLLALVAKELRLQQMVFVVAAIYVLLSLALLWVNRGDPTAPLIARGAVAMLYSGVLAILVGSLASAEERRLGTLEWQILLPMAAWQQWAVKIAVTFGLVLLLGVGLPVILDVLSPLGEDSIRSVIPRLALALSALAAISLYLSSLSGSGVAALVLTFPVIVAARFFAELAGSVLWRVLTSNASLRTRLHDPTLPVLALGAGLVLLLLWLGFRNHRSADRTAARAAKQALAIAGYITAAVGVLILLGFG